MGFLSFMKSIGNGIKSAFNKVKDTVAGIADKAVGAATHVYNDASHKLDKVLDLPKTALGDATKLGGQAIGGVTKLGTGLESTLSMPLILIGGAIALFALNSQTKINANINR